MYGLLFYNLASAEPDKVRIRIYEFETDRDDTAVFPNLHVLQKFETTLWVRDTTTNQLKCFHFRSKRGIFYEGFKVPLYAVEAVLNSPNITFSTVLAEPAKEMPATCTCKCCERNTDVGIPCWWCGVVN
jgi:hypothetical protein